ncbi:hypothetical protein DLM76_00510 [Leptospira yasudae]|nr:hypothetical protein DLM76_00510 [Leptospira yasudae]
MTLGSDGLTVSNFISEESSPNPLFPDRFIFYSPETAQSYKIIVIASNTFGKSAKEINSVPPNPPNGPCFGAVAAPVTIGNCTGHCIQVTLNGNLLEFIAKDTTTSIQDYFYLDLTTSTPSGGNTPIPFTFIEHGLDGNPVPIGSYSIAKQTLNTLTYTDACININSYRILDSTTGGFFDSFKTQKIIVP